MAPSGEPSPAHTRVAIVNPQPLFTDVLRLSLDSSEHIDVVADVGQTDGATEVLSLARPDVVLFVVIGETQDIATMRELASSLPDSPLVVLAHSSEPHLVAASYEAGASGYLTLATPLGEIVELVRSIGHPDSTLNRSRLRTSTPARESITPGDPLHLLTDREVDVLRLFSRGIPTRTIATELGISVSTVRTHIQNILTKLGVHSKLEAAAYAARHNLT